MKQTLGTAWATDFGPSIQDDPSALHTIDPFHSSRHARLVRDVIRARSRRREHFDESLFSDPAWDILLELFVAHCENQRVPVSSVGHAGRIPLTTALRWLTALEAEGLIDRQDDPSDRRRTYLSLTDQGLQSMHDYFSLGPVER